MQADTGTFPPTGKGREEGQSQQAVTTKAKIDKGEGEIFGEIKTGKPSDQTPNRTDSAGQGETGQDQIHTDGTSDNPIQPKPDRV